MFEEHMKWAKYTPLMLRRDSTPSFPEERLSRLTPPYFHSAEAQTSQQISGGHYIWAVNFWLQERLKEILSTVDCLWPSEAIDYCSKYSNKSTSHQRSVIHTEVQHGSSDSSDLLWTFIFIVFSWSGFKIHRKLSISSLLCLLMNL